MDMGWFPADIQLKLANELGRIVGCESVQSFKGRGHLSFKNSTLEAISMMCI